MTLMYARTHDETRNQIAAEVRERYPTLGNERVNDITRTLMRSEPSLSRLSRGVRAWEIPARLDALENESPVLFVGARRH